MQHSRARAEHPTHPPTPAANRPAVASARLAGMTDGRRAPHPANTLNELTGEEWLYFTKSLLTTAYPSELGHAARRVHGANKPPRLMARLIEFFSRSGELVLDPFAGVGGTLLGAAIARGRDGRSGSSSTRAGPRSSSRSCATSRTSATEPGRIWPTSARPTRAARGRSIRRASRCASATPSRSCRRSPTGRSTSSPPTRRTTSSCR